MPLFFFPLVSSHLLTFASNNSNTYCTTFTQLLYGFLCDVIVFFFFCCPLSNCSNFHTSDCFKLGNVHSLQIAMNKLYIKIKKLFLLISISFYITGTIFTVEIISNSLVWTIGTKLCKQLFLFFLKKNKKENWQWCKKIIFFLVEGQYLCRQISSQLLLKSRCQTCWPHL